MKNVDDLVLALWGRQKVVYTFCSQNNDRYTKNIEYKCINVVILGVRYLPFFVCSVNVMYTVGGDFVFIFNLQLR